MAPLAAPASRRYTTLSSPIGELLLLGDGDALTGLYLQAGRKPARVQPGWRRDPGAFATPAAQLAEFFAGGRADFDLTLRPPGTAFQLDVWRALREIPSGETRGYGELARKLGRPRAARAVGAANGANPISVIVPCHRLVGATGRLTDYAGGLASKRLLLDLERPRSASPMGR